MANSSIFWYEQFMMENYFNPKSFSKSHFAYKWLGSVVDKMLELREGPARKID